MESPPGNTLERDIIHGPSIPALTLPKSFLTVSLFCAADHNSWTWPNDFTMLPPPSLCPLLLFVCQLKDQYMHHWPSQGLGGSPHSSPFLCLRLIYENIFYSPNVSQSHPNCHCPSSVRIVCCWDDLSNMVTRWWAPEYTPWWLLLTERTSLHCPAWYTRLLPRFAPARGPVCPTLRPHVGLSCSGLSDGPLYLCKYCSFFLTPTSASMPGKLLPICHISGQTPPLKSRPCLTQADWSHVFLHTSTFVHISITTSNYCTVWASPL